MDSTHHGARSAVWAIVAAAALLTGCASTNQRHGSAGGIPGLTSGPSATTVAGGPSGNTPGGAVGVGGGASGGGAASGGGTSTGGGGGGVGGGGSSAGASGAAPGSVGTGGAIVLAPGTHGTVKIGLGYPTNLSAAYAAFGANNLTGSDWKVWIAPIVDWVNAHGGIGGRTVVPVYHATDPESGTFQSQAQQACTAFTEDDHVFAVVGTVIADNEYDCLAQKNTPFLAQTAVLTDQSTLTTHPGLVYQPFMITSQRLGVWLDSIVSQHFFSPTAKTGLLEVDTPAYHHFADTVIKPRLAANAIKLSDEIAFGVPSSAASAGDLFAQAGSAVLRFRSEGITHIVLSPTGGAIPFVFMQAAESQKYRPRYALNSLEVPAFVTQNVPVAQLHGSLGVGWLPASDVFYKEVVHGVNPAEDLCYKITKRNGDEVKRYCDGLFFLKAALDHNPDFSVAGLRATVESMGTSFDSPWTFGTRFGPGRYDGASEVRPLAYVDACNCYRYSGGVIPVG